MTSILSQKNSFIVAVALLLFCFAPKITAAQESLSLSVTPPLFQLSAVPNQVWQSNIKIVNTNPFDITVYANPVNFTPIGEGGQGRFMPVLEEETQGQTLAEWISVTDEAIVVPKEQSISVPFTVRVPDEPAPGGHFAAILVGTKPPVTEGGQMTVSTVQMVSSLVFLRISGDVFEQARIREFSTESWFTEEPEAEFVLRFENSGNVHIRPQGNIVIYNMWGKRRGEIPINHNSSFGNVLPGSIRKFNFSWRGEQSFSDIGRYKAVTTLSFGAEARQNVSQSTIFWVIPIKGTLIALFIILVLVTLIRRAIRSYVNMMLERAGIDPELHRARKRRGDVAMPKRLSSLRAVEDDVEEPAVTETWTKKPLFGGFVATHWPLLLGVPSAILLLGSLFWFISGALTSERAFEATVETNGNTETINSEEMRHEELAETAVIHSEEESSQGFIIRVINESGEPGMGAEAAVFLEERLYIIDAIEPGLEGARERTTIISSSETVEVASELSKLLGGPLVSVVNQEDESKPVITVILGEDVKSDVYFTHE